MLTILSVFGTRPEAIKMAPVLHELKRQPEVFRSIVCVTAQHRQMLDQVLKLFQIVPDYDLDVMEHNQTPIQVATEVMGQLERVLWAEQPDWVLVQGDTTTVAAAAMAAFYMQTKVGHVEAGLRTWNKWQPFPEEINRRIVDHISDINLPYTEHARRYLLREGLPPDQVIRTGSPQKEVIDYHLDEIKKSDVLARLKLEPRNYFTVSIHREENVDNPAHLKKLIEALNGVAERYDMPLIFSCHPRTRKRLEAAGCKLDERVRQMPPLGFFDYNHLQMHSYCAISDSGGITEDASILGFPAITVRQAHERPEGMDEGVLIMSGLDAEHILASIEVAVKQVQQIGPARIPQDYDVDQVSWKIAKIIFSYVNFVNRKVWSKDA